MSKHEPTPAPWVCHSGMVWRADGSEDGIPIARMDRERGNGTMPVERDANARLISAAPGLLAEAKRFKDIVAESYYRNDPMLSDSQYERLGAIIAKAEGKHES